MYEVERSSFDRIAMKARARFNGKQVVLQGTWVWAPELSWYDETNCCWIGPLDWHWKK